MGRRQYPAAGTIKSIQRGVITVTGGATSGTATVSAVNTGKAELRHIGTSTTGAGTTSAEGEVRLVLTNGTTITATREAATGDSSNTSWELTEFY